MPGLPATLEGYYQEIGRAGRDGNASRTILMHSYADQRTHDFLLTRDYPPTDHLSAVFGVLHEDARRVEELREDSRLRLRSSTRRWRSCRFTAGAHVDFGGNVTVGRPGWKKTYSVQSAYRREQFEKVVRYTTSNDCRMAALVRHFGDVEDANRPCGHCDMCDPGRRGAAAFPPRQCSRERHWVQEVIEALRASAYKTPKGLRAEFGVGRVAGSQRF